MKLQIIICAAIALSGCASKFAPEEITSARAEAQKTVPLTPSMRNGLAAVINSAVIAEPYKNLRMRKLKSATLSELRLNPAVLSIRSPDSLTPFYCVHLVRDYAVPLFGMELNFYYQVYVKKVSDTALQFKVSYNHKNPPLQCISPAIPVTYEQFPEYIRLEP